MAPKALRAASTKTGWRGSGPREKGVSRCRARFTVSRTAMRRTIWYRLAVSRYLYLVGMDMWLTIVALVLLLTRVFWGPA